MAQKKVGVLVKEARTAAGLTQEELAKKAASGLTAAMISECERGLDDLTATQLKKIAVACGVTQASLVNAPNNLTKAEKAKKDAAKKTAAKTTTSKTSSTKSSTAKTSTTKASSSKTSTTGSTKASSSTTAKKNTTTSSSAKKTTATTSTDLTATEKKILEAYRQATSDQKKIALKILKGELDDQLTSLINAASGTSSTTLTDGLSSVIGDVLGSLLGGK